MKKTTKLPNYYYRIGLVMVLLFTVVSSSTKEMTVTERNQEFIGEAKSFGEIGMNKNTENVFLPAFPLKSD